MSEVVELWRCPSHGWVEVVEVVRVNRVRARFCEACGKPATGPAEFVPLDAVRRAVSEAAAKVTDRPRLTVDLVERRLRYTPRRPNREEA